MAIESVTAIEYIQPNGSTNTREFKVTSDQAKPNHFMVYTSSMGGSGSQTVVVGDGEVSVGGLTVEAIMGQDGRTRICVVVAGQDLGGRGGGSNKLLTKLIIGYHVW